MESILSTRDNALICDGPALTFLGFQIEVAWQLYPVRSDQKGVSAQLTLDTEVALIIEA